MSKERDTYELGAKLTYMLVQEWLTSDGRPEFAFPPRDMALLADLRDVGKKLARNDCARRLVDHLVETVVAGTGQAPTTMMLRVVLETLQVPISFVPLAELDLGRVAIKRRGEPS